MIAAVAKALDGEALTREELAAEVARITKSPGLADKLLGSWGSTLKPATYQGKLCFGPDRGRNVTFVRPDRWLKGKVEITAGRRGHGHHHPPLPGRQRPRHQGRLRPLVGHEPGRGGQAHHGPGRRGGRGRRRGHADVDADRRRRRGHRDQAARAPSACSPPSTSS